MNNNLARRGDISLIFSKNIISTENDRINIYQVESIEKSLKFFLESKIIFRSEQRRADDSYEDTDFPILVSDTLFPDVFNEFSAENKIILPIYYTVQEIHIIPFDEYKTLLPLSLKNNITVDIYNNFVSYIKLEISKISNIKISD
ncbi:hypothetical protein ACOY72_05430 [Acinetobacter seifertii]|uniref:Uncharacterized protein n=1 Tax=Acinetobacter seifertii TaxID=1530123 RepID=N8QZ42_9GAMM|nr:hypothetical protein [Acinetobacter seifertii]ENU43890.1 hypothetical protein F985_01382 [Acinetobacter seifertii]